ncbi:hypothetical protein PG994_012039 [Apiospora phragmitis]|uniref:Uncharacterized protein n=1 Tax=Apiospora phragmitis TaxID=2905665 RepID=A0ABR1TUI6_9PEZI
MTEQVQNAEFEMDVSLPWGAFPAEQYLIRHWEPASARSAVDQRRDLIRAFVQLDAIPQDWDATGRVYQSITVTRVPTEQEVRDVLAPWRPLRWREAALHLWRDRDDEEIWLRTQYGPDSDEKFQRLREADEDCDPAFEEDCRSWTVLDDKALFADDWSAALDILPELVGPTAGWDAHNHRHLGRPDELEPLRRELRDSVASALRLEGQGNDAAQLKTDDVEAGGGMALQAHVVATFLFVADAETFVTEQLRLLFLDARGNIVRETRVPFEQTWEMRDGWNAGKFRDSNFWLDRDRSELGVQNDPGSILGEKYKISGEIGRVLYQLD